MTTATLALKGMSCAACANAIETAIRQVPGVQQAQVNFATAQANVDFDEHSTSVNAIEVAVANAGYKATEVRDLGVDSDQERLERQQRQRSLLLRVVVSNLIGVVLIVGSMPVMLGIHIPGWPMFLHNFWLQLVVSTPLRSGRTT